MDTIRLFVREIITFSPLLAGIVISVVLCFGIFLVYIFANWVGRKVDFFEERKIKTILLLGQGVAETLSMKLFYIDGVPISHPQKAPFSELLLLERKNILNLLLELEDQRMNDLLSIQEKILLHGSQHALWAAMMKDHRGRKMSLEKMLQDL